MRTTEPHIPDQRTFAFHQKAADILMLSPERISEIHQTLDHWLTLEGTQAQGWAYKWKELIENLSITEIAELICQEGEQMDFYRKSSPFACLLSEEERLTIIRKYRYNHE